MQLRGCGLTRASRLVIILLVVQYLGLGQILAVTPTMSGGSDSADGSQTLAALDAVLPFAVTIDGCPGTSAAVGSHRSKAIPPDPVPLPRRLPRAPPAA
jgi:hypothetical protein